jgi:DinB family protein
MKFDLNKSIEILEKTPGVIRNLLTGLSEDWIINNEGPETFSPYDVVGHLIHGEKTDWPGRVQMILDHGISKTFVPYERFAMFEESKGKSLEDLLNEFDAIRKKNVAWLKSLRLTEADFDKRGVHPKFGEVTLRQLMSTWVIHDLTHMSQITRVMAKQYKSEMGPWLEYFRIMNF